MARLLESADIWQQYPGKVRPIQPLARIEGPFAIDHARKITAKAIFTRSIFDFQSHKGIFPFLERLNSHKPKLSSYMVFAENLPKTLATNHDE